MLNTNTLTRKQLLQIQPCSPASSSYRYSPAHPRAAPTDTALLTREQLLQIQHCSPASSSYRYSPAHPRAAPTDTALLTREQLLQIQHCSPASSSYRYSPAHPRAAPTDTALLTREQLLQLQHCSPASSSYRYSPAHPRAAPTDTALLTREQLLQIQPCSPASSSYRYSPAHLQAAPTVAALLTCKQLLQIHVLGGNPSLPGAQKAALSEMAPRPPTRSFQSHPHLQSPSHPQKRCFWEEAAAVATAAPCPVPRPPAPVLARDASPWSPSLLPCAGRELPGGTMSAYREQALHCAPELLEAGGSSAFRLPNGHAPAPDPAPAEHPTQPRVSVPKMGVRARIAEWPPRREQSRESLLENGHNGGAGLVRGGVARLPHRRSRDAEFRDGLGGSAFRAAPLRQRSSSEVTLSEQDEAEAAEGRAGLFREYGSTSSIDVQAVPEQSFFDMLSQFHQERPDQRSAAPARLGELLRAEAQPTTPPSSTPRPDEQGSVPRPESRVRKKSGGTESSLGTSSLFRKLRSSSRGELESGRGEGEDSRSPEPNTRPWLCPKSFAHYDAQSILFDLHQAAAQRLYVSQRRNTATGASAASAVSLAVSRAMAMDGLGAGYSSTEDLLAKDSPGPPGPDPGDCGGEGPLLLGCPHFRNETGGHGERNVSFLSASGERGEMGVAGGAETALTLRRSNASVSVLEVGPEQQLGRLEALRHYSIEHVDLGALYYRQHFHGKEHSNYFGTDDKLGPLVTLRGSILEDAVPSTARHGGVRGLPLKEVLEHVVPELGVACLRLALSTPKVTEQLLKLDEQGLSQKHKVGILLCRAGQSTEEEMYNNEEATPAFRSFLELLGEQVTPPSWTLRNIRSHFQHVFVIVRVHNPCSDSTCYSVAVTRMKDVPPFGPPIPSGATFRDPAVFRDFLLAKVINAENAAHKSEKFHTMATRTRQEYLRDLAENYSSSTPLDSAGKLNNLISLASKKRERARAREGAELGAAGAVAWRVRAQDFSGGGGGAELACVLGVSAEYVLLVDCSTKEVVFNCFCADVIGWTPERLTLRIYYGRGDHIAIRVPEGCALDIREMVTRLKMLTLGCETVDMTLRRNGLGQLGFHVRLDGTVAEVEEYGFAWQAGLRQGSRLVEICKVAAVTLSHEQMIDLLRTSVTVKAEPLAAGYRPPLRPPTWRWDSPPGMHNAPPPQRWAPVGPPQTMSRTHKALVPMPYREPQHLSNKRPVSFPENHYSLSPVGGDRVLPYRNPSASFSGPGAGLGGAGMTGPFVRYKPSPDRYFTPQRPLLAYEPHLSLDGGVGVGGAGGLGDSADLDPDPLGKGGSSDSGIDATTLYTPSPNITGPKPTPPKALHSSATYSGLQELACHGTEGRRRESSPAITAPASQSKGYRTRTFPPPSAPTDAFKPRACYTPQGYKTPSADKPRPVRPTTVTPTSGSSQPSSQQLSSSAPKSLFSKSKHSSGCELKERVWPAAGRRDAGFANAPLTDSQTTPSDLLFTCTLPTRRHAHTSTLPSNKVPLSASELSLTEVRDKVPPLRCVDPGLMPLPDTACGLEWASLVSAAKAFEDNDDNDCVCLCVSVQRAASLFSLSDSQVGGSELRPALSPVQFHTPQTPRTTPTFSSDEVPNDLSGRLYHLEEKQDKVALLAEMASLRENNQRLQEESLSASEQLRKFSQILTGAPTDRKDAYWLKPWGRRPPSGQTPTSFMGAGGGGSDELDQS
ncbi:hypothetical protein JZ751_017139 [Albula glossodonta]|uniref:Signal-induced proliferation-associated 1-like protein 3 n=1 Tax=Albula glossodonta TaxID=121402 RepID=A0A8T2NPI4_9TELE|nr:hypothetical protein JZ751_017139 [Albula glossodonta]